MIVPKNPLNCLIFGLVPLGLGLYMLSSDIVPLVVLGLFFLLVGVVMVRECVRLRKAGYGWLEQERL